MLGETNFDEKLRQKIIDKIAQYAVQYRSEYTEDDWRAMRKKKKLDNILSLSGIGLCIFCFMLYILSSMPMSNTIANIGISLLVAALPASSIINNFKPDTETFNEHFYDRLVDHTKTELSICGIRLNDAEVYDIVNEALDQTDYKDAKKVAMINIEKYKFEKYKYTLHIMSDRIVNEADKLLEESNNEDKSTEELFKVGNEYCAELEEHLNDLNLSDFNTESIEFLDCQHDGIASGYGDVNIIFKVLQPVEEKEAFKILHNMIEYKAEKTFGSRNWTYMFHVFKENKDSEKACISLFWKEEYWKYYSEV